jgi:hypothetical protein
MDKVYQVFISSTFDDLKDERQQISNALAKAGYVVAGMELFPAADQQQLEYIKRVIDRSDYYVVVVGGRYGSLADETASFTEKEFEYAKFKNIPVLAFLHRDPQTLPVKRTDQDQAKSELLAAFRKTLRTGRMVEFWDDANDLCLKVIVAVGNAVNLTPGVGWVRGDQAIDPKVLQEAERLRIENDELRKRISSSDELTFNPNILGPDDSISVSVSGRGALTATIGDIFVGCYDAIVAETAESAMGSTFGRAIATAAGVYEGTSGSIERDEVVKLRHQFEALGLIETKMVRAQSGISVLVWYLTDKGRKFGSSRRAAKR